MSLPVVAGSLAAGRIGADSGGNLPDMKKRLAYVLLFGVPGFFTALLVAFAVFGVAAGLLWVFVYGDTAWPESTASLLPAVFFAVFLLLWMASLVIGYLVGTRLEAQSGFNRNHIIVSAIATILPVALMALQQLGVGNIGPQHDSLVCADYCQGLGHAGSGMPPRHSGERSCSCLDDRGREVLTVPLDSIGG